MSINKLIGTIICEDMIEQDNGDWKVTFKYDKKFKEEYKKIFKLKRWSQKHFEEKLNEAINYMSLKIKEDKQCLDLNQGS